MKSEHKGPPEPHREQQRKQENEQKKNAAKRLQSDDDLRKAVPGTRYQVPRKEAQREPRTQDFILENEIQNTKGPQSRTESNTENKKLANETQPNGRRVTTI